ncbi:radical SAM protein [Thermodesulfobacteriota bacterium]
MKRRIETDMPLKFGAESQITLILKDRELVGSLNHFVRFDLYTTYAPSHPERHLGYWDMGLATVGQDRIRLAFRDGELHRAGYSNGNGFQMVWKGPLEPKGYCSFHVSLWEYVDDSPIQIPISLSGPTKHESLFARMGNLILPRDNQRPCESRPDTDEALKSPVGRAPSTWDVLFWRPGMDLPLECIMIPLTQRCNLKCPMCARQNSAHLEMTDVSEDVLDPLLEAAPHYMYAGLQGLGEPLLNPEIFRIATAFKKRIPSDSVLATTTNGMRLTQDASRKLVDLGLNSLIVSLDGASKEVFDELRPGADFDVVTRNLANAIEYGRKSGRKRLWFSANFVTHPRNLPEIPSYMKLVHNLGIDAVAFIHMRDLQTGEIRTWDEERLAQLFDEARELGERYGIRVVAPLIRGGDDRRCVFMQSAQVWMSGDVVPCLRMEPDGCPWPIKIFGNVRERPLLDIWDSPEYTEFRRRVLSGDYPEVCQGCNFCDGRVT